MGVANLLSDQIYRFIFDNSLDAILLTKPDGSVCRANNAACEMLGRSEEEIKQLGRSAVVDVSDNRLQILLEERAKNKQAKGEIRVLRKDGSTFPGYISSRLFYDDNNQEFSVIIIRDLTKEKDLENQQLQKINLDELTQIYNRRGFIERLTDSINNKEIEYFGLLMVDIDYFKKINDTFGHIVGDQILVRFADEIKSKLREKDFIGRYGGDEFVVFLNAADEEQTKDIANRVLTHFRNISIRVNDQLKTFTCSIGVKHYKNIGLHVNAILTDVDDNMYKAKINRDTIYYDF